MFAVISNSNLLRSAHALARKVRDQYANYRDALSAGLKEMWRRVRKAQRIVVERIAAAAKAAFRTIPTKGNKIASTLLRWGFRVWEKEGKRRIYINWTCKDGTLNRRSIRCCLQNSLEECLKQSYRELDRAAYYDLNDRSWHNLASWMQLNSEIA